VEARDIRTRHSRKIINKNSSNNPNNRATKGPRTYVVLNELHAIVVVEHPARACPSNAYVVALVRAGPDMHNDGKQLRERRLATHMNVK
jgi:hypothetical protein